jgi:hypothetical protein
LDRVQQAIGIAVRRVGKILFRNRLDAPAALTSIVWTQQSITDDWPAYTGFTSLHPNPVTGRVIHYGRPQSSASFFSQGFFEYDAESNAWTLLEDTGGTTTTCAGGSSTFPGPRHPQWQMAVDTVGDRFWLFSGVCLGNLKGDLWAMDLTTGDWTEVDIATVPGAGLWSAMIHDSVANVLFLFGSDQGGQTQCNWVYGPTDLNQTPGTLTAAQIAAGCDTADDWTLVSPVGGVQPASVSSPGMVYLPGRQEALLYGGASSGGTYLNALWRYTPSTQTWLQLSSGPPLYTGSGPGIPCMATLTAGLWAGSLIFHQTHNTGAPRTWLYTPATDTWDVLSSTGDGPSTDAILAEDPSTPNRVIAYANDPGELPEVWHGVLS